MAARELPADPRHAWLPAVLPAGARRFRTAAADLAVALTVAEAELVDDRPDVDIVHDEAEAPDAPVAIVPLHEDPPGAHSRTARAVQLAARSIALRRRAAVIALRLRRLGYSNVRVLLWQENEPLPASTRTGSLRSLLPLGALVVAERQEPRVTALQAAASTAGFRLARSPVVRQALVVAEDDHEILHVAIGPAGRQSDAAVAALALLRAAD